MLSKACVAIAVVGLAGCSNGAGVGTSVAFATAQQAIERVCMTPTSHRGILAAVRDLNWVTPADNDVEAALGGDGIVWSQVVESPRQDMLVAAGRLSGTSFCRVYVRSASGRATEAGLARARVLGAPLGAADFHQHIDGRDVTGWHRQASGDWRAVHLSVDAARGAPPDRSSVMVEVTRSAI